MRDNAEPPGRDPARPSSGEFPEQRGDPGPAVRAIARIVVAVVAGTLVMLLLFPFRVIDPEPQECSAALGYRVPCGTEWSLGAGGVTAVLVAVALFLLAARRRRGR